jgi:hypothetical protein
MTTPRSLLTGLAVVAAALASLGCASSRRMMDVSVFGEGNERLTDNRVNLFPLYYANRQKHSVLWPIGDWDDHGFAIRPLFNKQDDDYSVLFPLSSWDPKDGSGWALTAWWDKHSLGCLPIGGKGRDWWFAGPIVGKGRDWWFAGPIVRTGTQSDDPVTAVLPLAYWDRHDLWLAELFYGEKLGAAGYAKWRSMFGLMAFGERSAKGNEWWALPLLTYHNRQGDDLTHVSFPLWWQSDTAKSHSRTLFPLFHQQSDTRDGFSCWLTQLGGYGSSTNGNERLVSLGGPLYWDYRTPRQHITNVAGLYYRTNDAHYVLFGLGMAQSDTWGSEWRAWPLASGKKKAPHRDYKTDGFLQATSLYWHGSNGQDSSWHCWPLLAWGETSQTYQDFNILLGLLGNTHHTDAGTGTTRDARRRLIYRTEHTRPLPGRQNWAWVAARDGGTLTSDTYASLLTHSNRETHRKLAQKIHPTDDTWIGLGHWLMCPQGPAWKTNDDIPWKWRQGTARDEYGPDAKANTFRAIPYPSARTVRATLLAMGVKNLPAAADLASTGTRPQDRKRLEQALNDSAITWNSTLRRFDPLLTLWKRSEQREGNARTIEDEALWGLLWNYKRNPSESSFRLLWRMYEQQQEGEGNNASVRRNIFPFLRWDSSPDKSQVSFLWRVFDWQRSKQKSTGGHILFIPWGHVDG